MFVGRCGGSEVSLCRLQSRSELEQQKQEFCKRMKWLHFALSAFNVIACREGDVLPSQTTEGSYVGCFSPITALGHTTIHCVVRTDKYRLSCVLFHWQISQMNLEPTVLQKVVIQSCKMMEVRLDNIAVFLALKAKAGGFQAQSQAGLHSNDSVCSHHHHSPSFIYILYQAPYKQY